MNLHQDGALNPNYKHGLPRNKLYGVWKTIRQRCNNPNNARYEYYGQRGIGVCKEWDSYENFYKWAYSSGYKEGLSIERKNINKGYSPSNCCWIPMEKQASNTSRNIFITVGGTTKTQSEWARHCAIDNSTLCQKRRSGEDVVSLLSKKLAYPTEPGREDLR